MKKQILKGLKKLKPKESLLQAFRKDQPEDRSIYPSYYSGRKLVKVTKYKHYDFLQAEVEQGILKVGIWQRSDLMQGQLEPEFTIFIDRENEEWITLQHTEEKWLTAMIFNLPYTGMEGKSFGNERFATEETRKTIAEYLGIDGTAYKMIRVFQTEKKHDLLQKQHKSELDEIDEFIESVPAYPAGYNNDWLVKSGFKDCVSIVYHPGTNQGKCLRCGKDIILKTKPKHLDTAKCPACRAEATLRSWGKQKVISARKKVGILQKVIGSDDYCLSVQDVELCFKKENDYKLEIRKYGDYKFRLDDHFTRHEVFEWYEYRNTGQVRWCHAKGHGMGYYNYEASSYCALYEKNLKDLFKDTKLKYVPFAEFLRKTDFRSMYADEVLNETWYHTDDIEKLIKAGLYQMADGVMRGRTGYIKQNEAKLEDLLKLDKNRMRQAISMNVTEQQLKILQASKMAKVTVNDDIVRDLALFYPHKDVNDLFFVLQRNNLRKELNYLTKLAQEHRQKEYIIGRDYEDYLEQLDKLSIPKDKHSRFPANFYQTHEQLSEQIREMDEKIQKMEVAEKNRRLKKIVQELQKQYTVRSKKYCIIWPKSKRDFQTEGQKQNNCVGGYFDRVVRRETVVFFLRRKEEPETPFCTVEFKGEKLIQCRIAYNRDAPEDVQQLMQKIGENYYRQTQILEEAT